MREEVSIWRGGGSWSVQAEIWLAVCRSLPLYTSLAEAATLSLSRATSGPHESEENAWSRSGPWESVLAHANRNSPGTNWGRMLCRRGTGHDGWDKTNFPWLECWHRHYQLDNCCGIILSHPTNSTLAHNSGTRTKFYFDCDAHEVQSNLISSHVILPGSMFGCTRVIPWAEAFPFLEVEVQKFCLEMRINIDRNCKIYVELQILKELEIYVVLLTVLKIFKITREQSWFVGAVALGVSKRKSGGQFVARCHRL